MLQTRIRSALFYLVISGALGACTNTTDRGQDEKYIVEGEHQWAAATASGDVSIIDRLLADDYLGVAPDGTLHTKQAEREDTRNGPLTLASNHVDEVRVRFYGDMAIAQGSETWELKSGEPRRGRYVWTDTWLRRDHRWQVVAAEDLTAPAP